MIRAFFRIAACGLLAAIVVPAYGQRWQIGADQRHVVWQPGDDIPHEDCVEMTGEATSFVLRWGIDDRGAFREERSLVFPLLRRVPNNTHGSLLFRMAVDIPSLLSVDERALQSEKVTQVSFDGVMEVRSDWRIGRSKLGLVSDYASEPGVAMTRTLFPSRTLPVVCERYVLRNSSPKRTRTIYVPDYVQTFETDPAKGVEGSYLVRASIAGSGRFTVAPGDSVVFDAVFQALRKDGTPLQPDVAAELTARKEFIERHIGENLLLETPDSVINTSFHFSKIRAAESIIRTRGGYMHAPGGETFYAAVWANDQCEYVIPLFPFLGYDVANESAINTFRHYARFMNPDYRPLPSSIIAEGLDIWNGAGDRGDAAMCANGAARYALTRADRAEAAELWPFIEWCLEYCRRNRTADGVVASDSDELEGRFPVGRTNLATSTLYYDALLSAAALGRELGVARSRTEGYLRQARELAADIERFFGREISGYRAYRYSELNDKLRAWICMPLVVGLHDRKEGTIDALLGPELCTPDGLLTEQGDSVFWDRSTLYALRGIFRAGHADEALEFLHRFTARRLTGDHVPYFIEAWPEGAGSMRQLSAESGLYCRILTEGLFGIRPTGFRSFEMTPSLPSAWDRAALRHIRAFGSDFDLEIRRMAPDRLRVTLLQPGCRPQIHNVKAGATLRLTLKQN